MTSGVVHHADFAPTRRVSRVEEIDRQIVDLLARDGRMSFTDLGKATGLSTSAVHQRVKRLEQRGLITGYGATVNHSGIGPPPTSRTCWLGSGRPPTSRPVRRSCCRRRTRTVP